jgi:cytochrome c
MLAAKVIKGGKGSWGEVPMPPNPSVTPDEANKLVKWILSLK